MSPDSVPTLVLGRIASTISVVDLDRSIDFYRSCLGLEVIFTNGAPPGFAILKNGAAELHLTVVANHRPAVSNVAHLLVSDAGVLYEAMEALGVRIVKGLRDADYDMRGFVFADPDGNRIDVGQILMSAGSALPDRASKPSE